jgi:hypothetical protein
MANGNAAALVEYPTAEESWPASDDATCILNNESTFVTPDAARSMIYINGYASSFNSWCIENNFYDDYPLIYFSPARADAPCAIGNVFRNAYFEGNECSKETVKVASSSYNVFRDTLTVDGGEPDAPSCECFMRLTGSTKGNVVDRLIGWGNLTAGIVVMDGAGEHLGTECTNCVTKPGFTGANQMVAINGATESAASTTFSSTNA